MLQGGEGRGRRYPLLFYKASETEKFVVPLCLTSVCVRSNENHAMLSKHQGTEVQQLEMLRKSWVPAEKVEPLISRG